MRSARRRRSRRRDCLAGHLALLALTCSAGCSGGPGGPIVPPTPGETCVANASFIWTGSTHGSWSGCTPDAGDSFHANGFSLRIPGDLEIQGPIVADAGGRISVEAGVTLHIGSALRAESGGTLALTGSEQYRGRVERLAWYKRAARLFFPDRMQGRVRAGDFVHLLDDYGDELGPLTPPFQTRGGPPLPGMTRPAYARGWMLRVTMVSGNMLDVSLDDWQGLGTPYIGRRGIGGRALGLLQAVSPPTFHGLVTELRLDPASLQVVDGDLSDQYVEIAAGPCAGKLAKVLGATDMGDTAGDLLHVAGPWLAEDAVTDCGAGPAWINVNFGIRPGDPVAIYRMARVDGMGTGFIDVRDGHIEADRFDLENLGFFDKNAVEPRINRYANVVFRHGEHCETPGSGFMRRGNLANFRIPSPESDVSVIYAVAHSGYATWRGCGTFDLTSLVTFDQLSIHDSFSSDPAGVGGSHGFYSDGVGVRATRLLIARVTDDGMGGHLSGFESEPQPFVIEDARIFGVLPDVEKSAECFEPGADNWLDARTGWNEQQRVRGLIAARDLLAIGCSLEAVNVSAYGVTLDRVVVSGANYLDATYGRPLLSVAPSTNLVGASGNPLDDPANQSLVRDALVLLIGRRHSAAPFVVTGRCEGCVVVGDVGRVAYTRLWDLTDYARSFLHFTNSGLVLEEVSLPAWGRTSREIRHSVLLSEWATRLGNPHERLVTLDITRSAFGLAAGTPRILAGVADAGASVVIEGIVGTTAGGAGATSLGVTPLAQVADPCLETTLPTDASAFDGATVSGTIVRGPGPGPDASDFAPVRDHAVAPASPRECDASLPLSLGLATWNIGRVHADLGDLFLDRLDRSSTSVALP